MEIRLSPKQQMAMDAIASEQYRFILYGGAMGGGKTVWGLTALLVMCEMFPGSRWCVVRENSEKLRTTTVPSFEKLLPVGKLRQNPYEYHHPNGSVILFKGENYDQDKEGFWLRGLEVNGFLFEELNECQESTFDLAFSRAGRWKTTPEAKPIILATANPSNNWLKTRVYDKWKTGELPDKWLYVEAKIHDNPHLSPEYIENLAYMPKYKYMVLVEGNWDLQLKVGGEFYKSFEIDKHTDEVVYDPALPLHISWDDNVVPYLPLGIFQIQGKEIRMIDEILGRNPYNTIKAVCNELKRRYPHHNAGMFIYGDATAEKQDTKIEKGMSFYRIVAQELADYKPNMRIATSNPSVVQRGNFINSCLEKNYEGIKIIINSECKEAINDFVLTKEASDGTKLKEMATDPVTKARYQKVGHMTDLTDYVLCTAFAREFEQYQRGTLHSGIIYKANTIKRNSY